MTRKATCYIPSRQSASRVYHSPPYRIDYALLDLSLHIYELFTCVKSVNFSIDTRFHG